MTEKNVIAYRLNKKTMVADFSSGRIPIGAVCWEWTGAISKQGYGVISFRNKQYKVHRLKAWLYHGLRLNDKRIVCHKCDNRRCLRVDHLFIGTNKDNTADAIKKDRFSMRERHYKSRLKESDVYFIRASSRTTAYLARSYGVGESTIRNIRQRNSWKSLKEKT